MTNYELTFHVADVPDGLADDLLDLFDCVIGTDHGGQQYITITASGVDCLAAAKAMTTQLITHGMRVHRLHEDLANRNEIAERLGVTRQAVGNWVRRERGDGFPAPRYDVAGGVWLWGEVASWAEGHNSYNTNDMKYPTREDYDRINGWLVDGCLVPSNPSRQEWLEAAPAKVLVQWMLDVAGPAPVRAWRQTGTAPNAGSVK